MQKITTFLWFDDNAQEAVKFYCKVFKKSKILESHRFDDPFSGEKNKILTLAFQLEGQRFMAINGGPMFKFTEAISLYVDCKDQKEVDRLWAKLTANGGEESQCGWLKDKFGLSWQIVPKVMGKYLCSKDPVKAKRAMNAMLKMKKLDVAALKAAYDGK
ncbi:MAG: VOC family protein [Planctomycetes bacterium]|nr:VOC family protein [Planctomycetota bacterium]